ncbi:MAG: hypothetical protein HY675_12250 [Chloroflexi bacterium]|nr:hypothetical protein [Chloroflexota bacterium]
MAKIDFGVGQRDGNPSGIMERVSTRVTRTRCSLPSSGCIGRRSTPARTSAWPPCRGSFIAIDERARQFRKNRSDFIELAVWAFIGQLIRDEQDAKGSIHCDELVSLPKSVLTNFIGTLPPKNIDVLNQALLVALEIRE